MKNLAEVKKLYAKKDKMHNWNHILRIKKTVKTLKKDYSNLNENILEFLINYHGLKDYVKANKNNFPKNYIEALLRHNKTPKTIEEKIVHDANQLDNIGKKGIKKALAYGKMIGRTKEETFNYIRKALKNPIRFYTIEGKKLSKLAIKEMREEIQ